MDSKALEEIKRQFGVMTEAVRSDVRAVAEAQHGLREVLSELRTDMNREFEETRSLMRLSYSELARRVHGLEDEVTVLRARLERVESRLSN